MCPKPTETRNVSRQSHIEDLEGIPGLFKALTEETDEDEDKWTTFTFPIDFTTVLVNPSDKPLKYGLGMLTIQEISRIKRYICIVHFNIMSCIHIARAFILFFRIFFLNNFLFFE